MTERGHQSEPADSGADNTQTEADRPLEAEVVRVTRQRGEDVLPATLQGLIEDRPRQLSGMALHVLVAGWVRQQADDLKAARDAYSTLQEKYEALLEKHGDQRERIARLESDLAHERESKTIKGIEIALGAFVLNVGISLLLRSQLIFGTICSAVGTVLVAHGFFPVFWGKR